MISRNRYEGFLLLLALSGCATPGASKLDYSPPKVPDVHNNEVSIDESFDVVWDRLVGRLATGFFVINNIDKASRLINVSFSSDSPENYVDCGESTRKFSYQKEEKTYVYNVAQDSAYKVASTWGPNNNLPNIAEVSRDASLEGRINVYVAPQSSNETKVSANVKYILRVTTTGTGVAFNAFGTPVQQFTVPSSSSDVSFTTGESGSKNWGTGGSGDSVTCRAKGTLEKSILDMARL
ncbi:MAG: hypothetical protein KGZ88_16220 [Methylomicrobium sp.]|nr:hypothetical protein [Methylomicrobium sp.]